jgi:tetratricopeptide (TPR) repeat protein
VAAAAALGGGSETGDLDVAAALRRLDGPSPVARLFLLGVLAVLPLARGDLGIYVSRVASTLGSARLLEGRVAEALPLLEEAAQHGRAIGFMHGHSLVLGLLADGYPQAGRPEDASRTAGEALELARKHGERGWEAWALRALGGISGDPAHYGAALALAVELGMRPLQAHCHLGLGEVEAAVELYRSMDMPYWLARADAVDRRRGATT